MTQIEPILQENKDRFVMFPIAHKEIWKLYKEAETKFWAAELDLVVQRKSFAQLEPRDQQFLKFALAAQVVRHRMFDQNSLHRFLSEVQYPEARCFYGFAEMMGNIHYELISVMQAGLSVGQKESESFILEVGEWNSVKAINTWINDNYFGCENFAKRLIAYACCKRILFCSVKAGIISFGAAKSMEETAMIEAFVYEDEGAFTDFSITLYAQLEHKEPASFVKNTIYEVMQLEMAFITEFKEKVKSLRISEEDIRQYVIYLGSCIEEAAINNSKISKQANPLKPLQWERLFTTIDKNKKEFVMDKTIKLDVDF